MKKIFKTTWKIFRKIVTDLYLLVIVLLLVITAVVCVLLHREKLNSVYSQSEQENLSSVEGTEGIDFEKLIEIIKRFEAERPPRIKEGITEEELYNNPYIKHIRIALDGYLDGTNNGIEEGVADDSIMPGCGLSSFDRSYYKSKFIILSAADNEYGGIQANIVFIDKPDKMFWVWVYNYSDDGKDNILRGFCENGPSENKKEEFAAFVNELIKNTNYSL